MYDLVVKNGKIVDGTGNPWFRGEVAVSREGLLHSVPLILRERLLTLRG